MRYLYYTNYESGNSGLSNGIMSIEIGVILAHLTNRFLVLEGNVSPPANIVSYDGRVNNESPSRVTDLIDIPVPWGEPDAVDMEGLESLELTDQSLSELVLYFPKTLDPNSADAKSFARDRDHWLTVTGDHERVPVLRLSEDPNGPGTETHRSNLCFYSYLFYLNDETRRSVYRILQRMQPKPEFAELARRVARDIGPFNAVHLRRGDFKVTYGVTTLDRQPWEAIEAMDEIFSRNDPLVIVTDERDDPFFDEIKLAYPHHYFIDWHILDHYGEAFARLPRTDSLSLAYLSQLIAAEAEEFIGTMTSTFSAIIQRYRGNRGKSEAFRYLWNEIPDQGQSVERGRHAISNCIALDRGTMAEEFEGPYSWNRVSQLLSPAWMREWPESFLTSETLATGSLASKPREMPAVIRHPATPLKDPAVMRVTFEKLQIAIKSEDDAILELLGPSLGARTNTPARNVIATLEISATGNRYRVGEMGKTRGKALQESELPAALRQEIVTVLSRARKHTSWLAGTAISRNGRGVIIAGDMGRADRSLMTSLKDTGWNMIDSGLVAIRNQDLTILPLGARERPEGASAMTGRVETPLSGFIVAEESPLHDNNAISPLSPAAAVAALIPTSNDFKVDRIAAVKRLCDLVEKRPVVQLHWSDPLLAESLISSWADNHSAAMTS